MDSGNWIFIPIDCEVGQYGDIRACKYYDLNQNIRTTRATTTLYINSVKDKVSVDYSYVKAINLDTNQVVCVNYKDWLERIGNYNLLEPKEDETEIDEW